MKLTEKIKNNKNFNKIRILKNSFDDYKSIQHEQIRQQNKKTEKHEELSEEEKKQIRQQIKQNSQQINTSTYKKLLPQLSIIITPTTDNIENILTYLSYQTYQNLEIIILNPNGIEFEYTTDYTIVEYADENLVKLVNQAICDVKGEYILFINSDVIFDKYFIENLVNTMPTNEKTVFCDVSLIDYNTYHIFSNGMSFKKISNIITPTYNNTDDPVTFKNNTNQIITPASMCFITKKDIISKYLFDTQYDTLNLALVDLSLRLYDLGYKCFNLEFIKVFIKNIKIVDTQDYFIEKWEKQLSKWFYHDKIYADKLFSKNPLTVAFVVTQSDEKTTAGDYFTAETLARSLDEFGWNVTYLSQHPTDDQNNWYFIGDDVDVVISLLDRYDISKIQSDNTYLKIAWLRNWFERWTMMPYFIDYDVVLASSKKACEYIKNTTGKDAILYPLATDPVMFNKMVESRDEYLCDYCFTGSYWGYEREIVNCLKPDVVDYKFNLYGLNWELNDKLGKYHKGFISYDQMPLVYASAHIIIDDANHVTVKYGSVNSRVFDAISMGKLVITNGTLGNKELFDGLIPEYHSMDELTHQINYYMEHDYERYMLSEKLRKIVLENHTYKIRAEMLFNIVVDYYL